MIDFLSRLPLFAIALALAGCAAEGDTPQSPSQAAAPGQPAVGATADGIPYEGRFSGPVVPTSPNCGRVDTGRLRFNPGTRAGRFTFEPGLGVAPLFGESDPAGNLVAGPEPVGSFTPGTPPGWFAGPGGRPPRLEAVLRRVDGAPVITGTMMSGQCRWNVTLRRS